LTEFFPEGEDAEGFLDTAQGDMERVALLGLVKDAFQAVLEEVKFLQELVVPELPVLVRDNGQGPAHMFSVAGEGGDGKAVLGGEGTQGRPGQHGVGNRLKVGVSADGTAFIHEWPFLTSSGKGAR
jgi:hypothetical protein